MKFAIIAMIGSANALPVLSDAADCLGTNGNACTGGNTGATEGLGTASVDAAGAKVACGQVLRGQLSSASAEIKYYLQDTWGYYATDVKLNAGAGSACKAATTPSATECKAATGTSANILGGTYTFTTTTGMTKAKGGHPVMGAAICPQAKDMCDIQGATSDKKLVTLADKAATAITVEVNKALTVGNACTYILEATCDAPYVQVGAGDHTTVVYTIAEWDNRAAAAKYVQDSTTDAQLIAAAVTTTGIVTAVKDNLTRDSKASLLKLPLIAGTYSDVAQHMAPGAATMLSTTAPIGLGCQGCNAAGFPVAKHHRYVGDGGVDTNAYVILEWIAAKNAEYKAFTTEKTAYDTKRADYDKKLEAAEKVTDAQAKDIFKLWFPTKEDTDAIKAVPVRPSKPTAPTAYQGPQQVPLNVGTSQKVGVTDLKEQAITTAHGSWSNWVFNTFAAGGTTNKGISAAQQSALKIGKSWGSWGFGGTNGVTSGTGLAADGSGTGLGVTWLRDQDATTCNKHYMMTQIGTFSSAAATGSSDNFKITLGVKEFARTMKLDSAPSAASDPKTPKTSAHALSMGAALVLTAAMTLY